MTYDADLSGPRIPIYTDTRGGLACQPNIPNRCDTKAFTLIVPPARWVIMWWGYDTQPWRSCPSVDKGTSQSKGIIRKAISAPWNRHPNANGLTFQMDFNIHLAYTHSYTAFIVLFLVTKHFLRDRMQLTIDTYLWSLETTFVRSKSNYETRTGLFIIPSN